MDQPENEAKQGLVNDLRELLMAGIVGSQDELCAILQAKGHQINQSKLSRVLRKLNASKEKNEKGEFVYRIPREPAPPTASTALSHLITRIAHNEALIVIFTTPGAASLIARLLDYHHQAINILATLAGDDVIYVTPNSIHAIESIVADIKKLLFN